MTSLYTNPRLLGMFTTLVYVLLLCLLTYILTSQPGEAASTLGQATILHQPRFASLPPFMSSVLHQG